MAFKIEISARAKNVSYPIRDIMQRAALVEASGVKLHRFNIGDPNRFDFAPPAHITEAIIDAVRNPKYSGYCPSEGDPQLREAVAKAEGVSKTDVFITAGLSEGISFLLQSLLDPGDNALLPSPSYPLYTSICKVLDSGENFYRTDEDWQPDTDDLRKKVNKNTKAIVVINPNNPTGASYPRKTLQAIVDIAGENGLPIIADEIYHMLTFEEPSVRLSTIAKDVPVISGNGLSKNYVYTGARVGYAAFHGGEELDALRASMQKFCNARLSINWEMQRGAIAAYTQPASHVAGVLAKLRPRRDLIHRLLNEIPGINAVLPQAAFYIFPKVSGGPWKNDYSFVYDMMDATGIVGVPGGGFSPDLPGNFFRLVYLPQEGEISEAMGKLDSFMRKRLAN